MKYSEILKLFMILMLVQIGFVMFLPVSLLRAVPYFLIVGALVSGAVAYYLYLRTKHTEFWYDQDKFTMRTGRSLLTRRWEEFSKVLLVKVRGTEFIIRLCDSKGNTVDIRPSRLGVNPFRFRVKILELVDRETSNRKSEGTGYGTESGRWNDFAEKFRV